MSDKTGYTPNYSLPYPKGKAPVAVHADIENLARRVDAGIGGVLSEYANKIADLDDLKRGPQLTTQDNLDQLRSRDDARARVVPFQSVAEALGLPEPDQGVVSTIWLSGGRYLGNMVQHWEPARRGGTWTRYIVEGQESTWTEWYSRDFVKNEIDTSESVDLFRDLAHSGLHPVPNQSIAGYHNLPEAIQGSLLVLTVRLPQYLPAATQMWLPRGGAIYLRSVRDSSTAWTAWEKIGSNISELSEIFVTKEHGDSRYVRPERLAVTDGNLATLENLIQTGRLSQGTLEATYATKSELSEVATGDPLSVTDVSVASAISDGQATRAALDENSLSTDGGTIHGDLKLETPPNTRSNRVILEAWERSNPDNNRAGDVLELHWRTPYAKPFIGWWDSTDPNDPRLKVWMGAHDLQNNPDPDAPPHRHWSIEVGDRNGNMQTRFAIDYDKEHTQIYTSSADFRVGWGALGVAVGPLEFTTRPDGEPENRRWSFNRSGLLTFDLLLHRHDDDGEPEAVARMRRDTGHIAVGSDFEAERQFHVRTAEQAALFEGTSENTNSGLVLFRHTRPERRVLQTEVAGDQVSRFSLETSGKMEWGDGTARDMSLAPHIESSQRQLRLAGGDLRILEQGRGLIMADEVTGENYRIVVRNGEIRTFQI